jgi:hypothetical protein
MVIALNKHYGIPIAEDLEYSADFPHTITYALLYRSRINSYNELPDDKKPPRNLWDKPYQLNEFMDEVYGNNKSQNGRMSKTYIEFDPEDVE